MKHSDLRMVNLSGDYIIPKVTENRSRKPWIEVGIEGSDDFFSTLIKKYQTSPTQQSCIDGITQLLYGLGLHSNTPTVESSIEVLTDDEEIKRIILDYKLFGQCAIQCVFSPDRKSIIGFYHLPVDTLRSEKCDDMGQVKGYYYSPDWTNKKLQPTWIPTLGSGEWERDVQVLYYKRYAPGYFYYTTPDYYSSIQYCSVEEEISNLHLSNIRNGFMPSAIINFNGGTPPEEEQALIENAIANKFSGTSNAGRFILSFNENSETKTTVDMMRAENLHENYKFLSEEARDKIMLSHRITSQLLFGIKSSSGFSSNADELKTSYDVFMQMVIKPMQSELIKMFSTIFEINGIVKPDLYFEQLVPYVVEADMIDKVGTQKTDQIINDGEEQIMDNTINPIINE